MTAKFLSSSQSSVMSPFLFLIFIEDLIGKLADELSMFLYINDVNLLSSKTAPQTVEKWQFKIKLNYKIKKPLILRVHTSLPF